MIFLYAKKHEIERKIILAVCDKEHLGKTFEEGELSFTVSEKFYKGNEITPKELEDLLNDADSINLFGEKCVTIAERKELISEKGIKKIKGIKHAQIYRV